jgi:Homeodomain-like domain-containing protein
MFVTAFQCLVPFARFGRPLGIAVHDHLIVKEGHAHRRPLTFRVPLAPLDTPCESKWGGVVVMARLKNDQKRKHKVHVPSTPTDTALRKKAMVKLLAAGVAPGDAAEKVGISRSTGYNWKTEDKAFSAQWDNAVETSLDKLETELYDIAKNDPDNISPRIKAIETTLKHRRYGNGESHAPRQQTNFILNVTMEEHFKRLHRLGVPVPEIESDYEELDAPTRK